MLRYLTAGESHGPCLTVIIEGVPAGLSLEAEKINARLQRRQGGYGRGKRMEIEQDRVQFLSGVRSGCSLGSPLALSIPNRDWANWEKVMGTRVAETGARIVKRPRPGHADLAGGIKYHQQDLRNILERASARETAARVAVGAICCLLLAAVGIEVAAHVVRIGEVNNSTEVSWESIVKRAPDSPVYCADPEAERDMLRIIDMAEKSGDTLGGIFEIVVRGVPVGLGSHVHWDRRLDGRLAQALMSIPAIKGVEIGRGFQAAALLGSQAHDEIFYSAERGFYRQTNRAGGIEGGISNGENLVLRAAMKPIN